MAPIINEGHKIFKRKMLDFKGFRALAAVFMAPIIQDLGYNGADPLTPCPDARGMGDMPQISVNWGITRSKEESQK